MKTSEHAASPVNRRDFIRGGSFATVMALMGGVRLQAWESGGTHVGSRVKVGLIGLGGWGREILSNLGRLPQAEVAAICDHYAPFLTRSGRNAPGAARFSDYQELLANPDIRGVVIATPTHQHRDITIAALQAGKHVYCEAPLAHTVEDARAIAQAAVAAPSQVFQAGLQHRADPQRHFLLPFIRSGALGRWILARTQYFKKESWRLAAPTPERQQEVNWRLDEKLSLGLAGEIGMHQLDQVGWYMGRRPLAVSGEGWVRFWNDGRKVADTVHAHLEFPDHVNAYFDASLATSFGGDPETYHGSDATIMMRGGQAWMFKEVDSPLLGWEVYARKEQFHNDTGIVLRVDGSKQESFSEQEATEAASKTALYHSLSTFVRNVGVTEDARRDFAEIFGDDDPEALAAHLAEVPHQPSAGALEGFQATVLAIKAAEAVAGGKRIELNGEWFELA